MSKRVVELKYPLGGLNRRTSLQTQPPFSTPDCDNVLPRGFAGRERGGSRPGLVRVFGDPIPSTTGSGTITDLEYVVDEEGLEYTVATGTGFTTAMVGVSLTFTASGNAYTINNYISSTRVHLLGDASAEANGAFTIGEHGSPIRLLAGVRKASNIQIGGGGSGGGQGLFIDEFAVVDPSLLLLDPANWSKADGTTGTPPKLRTRSVRHFTGLNRAMVQLQDSSEGIDAAALVMPTSMDVAQPYTVELSIDPYWNETEEEWIYLGQWSIFVLMADSTPNKFLNGVQVLFRMTGHFDNPTTRVRMYQYVNGSPSPESTEIEDTTIAFKRGPRTLRVVVTGTPPAATVTVSVDNVQIFDHNFASRPGNRVGFGLRPLQHTVENVTTARVVSDYFKMFYQIASDQTPPIQQEGNPPTLVASAAGRVFYSTPAQLLTEVAGVLRLRSDVQVQSAERLGKLYIADSDPEILSGFDGTVSSGKLDAPSVTNWTTHGIDTDQHIVVITDSDAATLVNGNYTITTIHATDGLTLSPAAGAGDCTYRIARKMKVFDTVDNTLSLWRETAGLGVLPTGCHLICVWQDRIVLAGYPAHIWYMSRVGDPLDWDYSVSAFDPGRATASTVADAGQLGEPLTALIPWGDDYLIFACEHSLWVLRGSPTTLGSGFSNLSRQVGVIAPRAYCHGPSGEIVFLSRDGVYYLAAGATTVPEPFSRDIIPKELVDIEVTQYNVSLHFDVAEQGVHLYLTPYDNSPSQHYRLDWPTKTFLPFSFKRDHEPTVMTGFNFASGRGSTAILGCRDGFIRRYDPQATGDDGETVTSYVLYGPMRMSNGDYNAGRIDELIGVLAEGSQSLTWEIYSGNTNEEAFRFAVDGTAPDATGTWSTGLNPHDRPRVRGTSFVLKLSSTTLWEIERITAVLAAAGKARLS